MQSGWNQECDYSQDHLFLHSKYQSMRFESFQHADIDAWSEEVLTRVYPMIIGASDIFLRQRNLILQI